MPPNLISRLEADQRPNASFATIARVAQALHVSLDEIAARCGFDTVLSAPGTTGITKALAELAALKRGLADVEERAQTATDALVNVKRPKTKRH